MLLLKECGRKGDKIEVVLPMEIQKVTADKRIKARQQQDSSSLRSNDL